MTWNYRILRRFTPKGEEFFAIHEVYYHEDGTPHSCSEGEIAVGGGSLLELRSDLECMNKALTQPVIDYQYFLDREKK